MSEITIEQAWDAVDFDKNEQDGSASTATVYYIAGESEDESAVIAAVLAKAPATFEGIPRQGVAISERLTQTDWKVEVKYAHKSSDSNNNDDEDADSQFNFEFSSGSKKVVYSRKTVHRYPANAENRAGINDGEGIEIIMPVSKFSETHFFRGSKINTSYKKKIANLVGKINKSAFKGYAAGQVLFTGCSGSRTGDSSKDKWQVTFSFSVGNPQSGIRIGQITGIQRGAWDVIWCQYKEEENEAKTETLKAVKAVFVEQVYEEADFGSLGI